MLERLFGIVSRKGLQRSSTPTVRRQRRKKAPSSSHLAIESLEDRRLLSVFGWVRTSLRSPWPAASCPAVIAPAVNAALVSSANATGDATVAKTEDAVLAEPLASSTAGQPALETAEKTACGSPGSSTSVDLAQRFRNILGSRFVGQFVRTAIADTMSGYAPSLTVVDSVRRAAGVDVSLCASVPVAKVCIGTGGVSGSLTVPVAPGVGVGQSGTIGWDGQSTTCTTGTVSVHAEIGASLGIGKCQDSNGRTYDQYKAGVGVGVGGEGGDVALDVEGSKKIAAGSSTVGDSSPVQPVHTPATPATATRSDAGATPIANQARALERAIETARETATAAIERVKRINEAGTNNVVRNAQTILNQADGAGEILGETGATLGAMAGAIAGPYTRAAGAIIGWKTPEAVVGLASTASYYVAGAATELAKEAAVLAQPVATQAREVIDNVARSTTSAAEKSLTTVIRQVSSTTDSAAKAVRSVVDSATQQSAALASSLAKESANHARTVDKAVHAASESAKESIKTSSQVVKQLESAIVKTASKATTTVRATAKQAVETVGKALGNATAKATSFLRGAVDWLARDN